MIGNVADQTGGWALTWRNGSELAFSNRGTSGGDDRTFGGTRTDTLNELLLQRSGPIRYSGWTIPANDRHRHYS